MRAGRLRTSVVIERPTNTPGTDGGFSVTWSTFATAWAGFEVLTGREYFASDEIRGDTTHRITIRHVSGVTRDMRVRRASDSRVFDITAPINLDERNRTLILLAKEVD